MYINLSSIVLSLDTHPVSHVFVDEIIRSNVKYRISIIPGGGVPENIRIIPTGCSQEISNNKQE